MSADKVKEEYKLAPVAEVAQPDTSTPNQKLAESDVFNLELAKSRRQTTMAEAKAAMAENDKAELAYRYFVLQIYMKYGLTERDAINENGEIIKDGATPQNQGR